MNVFYAVSNFIVCKYQVLFYLFLLLVFNINFFLLCDVSGSSTGPHSFFFFSTPACSQAQTFWHCFSVWYQGFGSYQFQLSSKRVGNPTHAPSCLKGFLKVCHFGKAKLYPQFWNDNPEEEEHLFWSLFILCGHSTGEPASIVCNDEQGDLFYFVGPHWNQCWPQPTQEKREERFCKKCRWMDLKGKN